MTKELKEKMNSLSSREQRYFKVMNGQSGVLFITAQPGVAKSAIMRSIAKKLDFDYIDIRLSMVDEVDVGLFPYRKELEIDLNDETNSKSIINVMSYAIPEWAIRANKRPTIIHFEELNRAPLAVRNAALQILLERAIGYDFKFNDNVFMVSSGNLGDKDGTTVEEFDSALNNRLIHMQHTLTLPEWISEFANKNVHPVIVSFLKTHEEKFLNGDAKISTEHSAYPTPRSWTFLSDYIVRNYGMESSINEWHKDMTEIACSYVGVAAQSFIRFLDDTLRFGVNELLNNFDDFKNEIETLSRDKKSELLNALKEKDIKTLNPKQKENLKRFIVLTSDDEVVSFLLKILDDDFKYMNENDEDNQIIQDFLDDERFAKYLQTIYNHVDDEDDTKK